MLKIFKKLLDTNQKELDKIQPIIDQINQLEDKYKDLKDEDLVGVTAEFKLRLSRGETLDDILPEAFALVREAARRTLGIFHYDVQLIAGIAFHKGMVAEQRTGEGKTLSATLALYLNALNEKGAHLVTVNDYLAQRDAGWMAPIFHLLGLSVGVIYSGEGNQPAAIYDPEYKGKERGDKRLETLKPAPRNQAYLADITYGTNNEFGFDYLRDNMTQSLSQMVQREHHFAIVDEVDSILIDEARTPLIISAPDTEPTQLKFAIKNNLTVAGFHYSLDKHKQIGNNAVIIEKLGAKNTGEKYLKGWGWVGEFDSAINVEELAEKCSDLFEHDIFAIYAGHKEIKRIGVCSGGAKPVGEEVFEIFEKNIDLHISGEIAEGGPAIAKDSRFNYFACGHYATEVFGVQALGSAIKDHFKDKVEVEFIDISNPL